MIQISSIEQYRRTLLFQGMTPSEIRALGGGASQFTINTGNPESDIHQMDAAVFVGDDWKLRPNLTVNLACATKLRRIFTIMGISRRALPLRGRRRGQA